MIIRAAAPHARRAEGRGAHEVHAFQPARLAGLAVLHGNAGIAIVVALDVPVEGEVDQRGRFDLYAARCYWIACLGDQRCGEDEAGEGEMHV